MCICVPVFMCVICVVAVPAKVRRRHHIHGNWSYRWVRHTLWVLGTEPSSSQQVVLIIEPSLQPNCVVLYYFFQGFCDVILLTHPPVSFLAFMIKNKGYLFWHQLVGFDFFLLIFYSIKTTFSTFICCAKKPWVSLSDTTEGREEVEKDVDNGLKERKK